MYHYSGSKPGLFGLIFFLVPFLDRKILDPIVTYNFLV